MSLQKFRAFLQKESIPIEVLEFPGSLSCKTALDAARSVKADLCQMANSLLFKTIPSGKPVMIMTAGHHRVREKVIGSVHFEGTPLEGETGISRADPDFVKLHTGYPIGGVPPFGHDTQIVTLIDDTLAKETRTLWAAGGTPNTLFPIMPQDLIRHTNGKVVIVD
jgi:prolyl-tRNA editing enzyme YbaK/EbsC (Cys-tRNA(Pro) deacylase)